MKCPKCQYLGFDTGDRCKNCGYDFSLTQAGDAAADTPLYIVPKDTGSVAQAWDTFATTSDGRPGPTDAVLHDTSGSSTDSASAQPLFALTAEEQPLVRLPVTPRRPLAVRRNAELPRPQRPSRDVPLRDEAPAPGIEPALDFSVEPALSIGTPPPPAAGSPGPAPSQPRVPDVFRLSSSPSRRFMAAGIDYALLAGIDVSIVYFTVRMSGLDMGDWRLLPLVPLLLFLVVIALAYVGFFTAIGGQTIGKMVARIRVVPDEPVPVGAVHAVKRTAAVALSWLTGGLGFLPALVGDHRALHDRLSGTRVVDLA